MPEPTLIRLGISACLLGEPVRYDGKHKLDHYLSGTLSRFVQWVPVCPEVAIGLGVPRAPIRLEGDPQQPRAVGVKDRERDVTEALQAFGAETARRLADVSGFVVKSKSPSCGMERVKVHPARHGRGLFTAELMKALPLLPVEEESRLGDPVLRENFIERVYAYRRWQQLKAGGLTAAGLVEFHAAHKLILMAHSPERYRALGRLVAGTGQDDIRRLGEEYAALFMDTLRLHATPRKHANVLQHLMGYLKKQLDAQDKAELNESIDRYRRGELPLVVPITLLRHHFRRHPHPYVAKQLYLEPHPDELMLRSGV